MDWKTSDFGTADPEDPLIASFAGTSISPERTSTSPPEVASDSVGPVEPVYSRPSMETPPQQRILQPLDDSGQGYSIYIVATEKFQESGKTPYVVYTIETKTGSDTFVVKRRFNEFETLHASLSKLYPACIIPPLPSKHRLEYLDRFSQEFIDKRKASLERFSARVYAHTILGKTKLVKRFLQDSECLFGSVAEEIVREAERSAADSATSGDGDVKNVFDSVGEAFMNAFTKLKKPDERFVGVLKEIEVYESNMNSLEKEEAKAVKQMEELGALFDVFGNDLCTLLSMEALVRNREDNSLGTVFIESGKSVRDLAQKENNELLGSLLDQLGYVQSIRETLKQRDQKQIDFESLSEYAVQLEGEKLSLMSRGNSSGASLGNFLRDKYEELKGADVEKSRKERGEKLDKKLQQVRAAIDSTNEITQQFSTEVLKELENYRAQQAKDLKLMLRKSAAAKARCFQTMLEQFNGLVQ